MQPAIPERIQNYRRTKFGKSALLSTKLGAFISADEAMVQFTGNKCPIIRAMSNKLITRGILLYTGVDYETKFVFNFNV